MEAAPQASGPLAWLQHVKRDLSDPFDLLGDVLDGQFRVESFVGEGELSVVYKGHHLGVEAPVAIKCLNLPETLHPALARPLVQGFKRASRVQYRLARGNLHIAQAIASGTTLAPRTGVSIPYLVREWFDGEPLALELARRRQESRQGRPLDETLSLLEAAFDAFSYAHGQGEVHLALNPTNLFLAHHANAGALAPTLKVLDFGMAGTMGALGSGTNPSSPQSPPGLRLLLPAYAAPEQLERTVGRLGPWTDVYALALIMLEVLSDRVVMATSETGALVEHVLDERRRPTPQSHGLKLPVHVDRALTRAVSRAPEGRQRSAAELWREVSRPASVVSLPLPAPLPPRPTLSMLQRTSVSEASNLVESAVAKPVAPPAPPAIEAPAVARDPTAAEPPAPLEQPTNTEPPAESEPKTEVFRPALVAPQSATPDPTWNRLLAETRALVLAWIGLVKPRLVSLRAVAATRFASWIATGRRFVSTRRGKMLLVGLASVLVVVIVLSRRRPAVTETSAATTLPPEQSPPSAPVPTKESEPIADSRPKTPFNHDLALRALDAKWRNVAKCRRGKVWGKETTTITFAEDGSVAEVAVGPLFEGTATGQCVANTLATVRVPRFDEGPAAVDYRVYVAPH